MLPVLHPVDQGQHLGQDLGQGLGQYHSPDLLTLAAAATLQLGVAAAAAILEAAAATPPPLEAAVVATGVHQSQVCFMFILLIFAV